MKTFVQILLYFIGGIAIFYVVAAVGLSNYDWNTRERVLRSVERELRPHASLNEMKAFMDHHTNGYDFDENRSALVGFEPQSRVDKAFADRKVAIHLEMNRRQQFNEAHIEIYYTFL